MHKLNVSPIAVTGLGIRFPGDVEDASSFWDLICRGDDGIREIPRDRWDVDRFYDPDPEMPGKMYVKKGGFLSRPIDQFDALFFGISPREAACMDPQQRLLLEVTWEALHHAGIVPENLAGSRTSVYVGAFTLDNLLQQMGPLARDLIGTHTAVGSTMTILANRISYLLDLRGPSLSIDTACSSSLVAVHQACQSLWSGECDMALAGGVNVIFRPEYLIGMCKGKFLAKDGYCKTFDERADGYARGEGAGVVVLKPLHMAQRNGDIIHGIIRATGVNQDGRSSGITSPNPASQSDLIAEVHARADVSPDQIAYVEAHGTGTQAGDSAETEALGHALGQRRDSDRPLPVGSVKANLGHLEAASGIAGLVKTMLCLQHETIPPIANLDQENPKIDFKGLNLHLPRQPEALRLQAGTAFAALNSFGYGGTNAHVLLQKPQGEPRSSTDDAGNYILTVSTKDGQALEEMSSLHQRQLDTDGLNLTDYCFSSAVRRGHYQHRLAIVADDRAQLQQALKAYSDGETNEHVFVGQDLADRTGPVFVFTGMGPQWWAMGRSLYQDNEVFRAKADECDRAFQKVAGWSILEEMLADECDSQITKTTIAQPANFVIQAALAAVWKSLGVQPSAIVGHSVGEVAAAYVAGVLSLEETALVSYHRSQIQSRAAGLGGMLAVGLSYSDAEQLLQDYREAGVDIAAVNGPESLTLSGNSDALSEIAAVLEERGAFHRALQVEVAFHSPYMDPLMADMEAKLADLAPKTPQVPLYSTVTGRRVEDVAYDARYWCQNARQAVLFAPAIEALLKDGHDVFLEVGPHPVLSTSIKQCASVAGKSVHCVASLHRKKAEIPTFHAAIAELYTLGCQIDWAGFYPSDCRYVVLPRYPWQSTSHWLEGAAAFVDRVAKPKHPLLGLRQNGPTPLWTNSLNRQLQPYLDDHCVENLTVLPGAAYVELGLATYQALHGEGPRVIEDVQFSNALIVQDHDQPQVRVHYDEQTNRFRIFSREGAPEPHLDNGERETGEVSSSQTWTDHASGRFSLLDVSPPGTLNLDSLIERAGARHISKTAHYENMSGRGLRYGECFQGVDEIYASHDRVLGKIIVPDRVADDRDAHCLHPAILDACFQTLLSVLPDSDPRTFIPTNIRLIRYFAQPGDVLFCFGMVESMSQDELVGSLTLCDGQGNVLVELFGIRARALSQTETVSDRELDDWIYTYDWEQLETPAAGPLRDTLLIAEAPPRPRGSTPTFDPGHIASRVGERLESVGHRVVRVEFGKAFAQLDDYSFVIRADDPDDLIRVLSLDAARGCERVVYFPPQPETRQPTHLDSLLGVLAAVKAAARSPECAIKEMCFVTQGAQASVADALDDRFNHVGPQFNDAGIVGLLRTAANEYPEYLFRSIDIATDDETGHVAFDNLLPSLVAELTAETDENEVVLAGTQRLGMRMSRRRAEEIDQQLDAATQASELFSIDADGNELVLKALPANVARQHSQTDSRLLAIMASTTLPDEMRSAESQGVDQYLAQHANYGLTTRLNLCRPTAAPKAPPLLQISTAGIASHSREDHGICLSLPRAQLLEANALSTVYTDAIAHYLFSRVHMIHSGEGVLIHAADGPVGRALLNYALLSGARVFATLLDMENRDAFVAAGVEQCYPCSTLCFHEDILQRTERQGLDVVLNPFSGEIAARNPSLLKRGGILLDFSGDAITVPQGACVQSLSLDQILQSDLEHWCQAFGRSIDKATGSANDDRRISANERLIAVEELKTHNELESLTNSYSLRLQTSVDAKYFRHAGTEIDGEAWYLVTGGFGGFGKEIVKGLVNDGARHIIIASRSGPKSTIDQRFLEQLRGAVGRSTHTSSRRRPDNERNRPV